MCHRKSLHSEREHGNPSERFLVSGFQYHFPRWFTFLLASTHQIQPCRTPESESPLYETTAGAGKQNMQNNCWVEQNAAVEIQWWGQ